jgi:hypothetical protein
MLLLPFLNLQSNKYSGEGREPNHVATEDVNFSEELLQNGSNAILEVISSDQMGVWTHLTVRINREKRLFGGDFRKTENVSAKPLQNLIQAKIYACNQISSFFRDDAGLRLHYLL